MYLNINCLHGVHHTILFLEMHLLPGSLLLSLFILVWFLIMWQTDSFLMFLRLSEHFLELSYRREYLNSCTLLLPWVLYVETILKSN